MRNTGIVFPQVSYFPGEGILVLLCKMSSSRLIQGLIGVSTTGLVLIHALPNLFPTMVQSHYHLPSATVPPHIRQMFQDITHTMQLEHCEKVELFINNGYTAMSVGSPWLPGGAAIGLPRTVLYQTVEDLQNGGVTFKGKRLNWWSEAGQKLGSALIMNENELSFTLAHELTHLKNTDFLTNCFLPAWWLYFTYRAVLIISAALPPTNPLVKVTIQALVWLTSSGTFLHQNTKLHHNYELLADETAASINRDFLQGGINMTLKRLKVNTILRAMNGDEGKRLYSKEGDDHKDWSHPRLTTRLRKLEELYAKLYLTEKHEDVS